MKRWHSSWAIIQSSFKEEFLGAILLFNILFLDRSRMFRRTHIRYLSPIAQGHI